MSNIGSLVAEQTRQTEEFKARKSAEREELSKMTDAGITSITQEPEAYLHYLDVQADNPGFSTSNVLLAMQQYPDVTVFNSVKGWNAIGRSVISGETALKYTFFSAYSAARFFISPYSAYFAVIYGLMYLGSAPQVKAVSINTKRPYRCFAISGANACASITAGRRSVSISV